MNETTPPAAGGSGIERMREAIARARGDYAPTEPVVLCGDPNNPPPDAMRADDPRWPGNRPTLLPLRQRITNRLADAVFCGACLRLRCNPGHWLTCCYLKGDGRV